MSTRKYMYVASEISTYLEIFRFCFVYFKQVSCLLSKKEIKGFKLNLCIITGLKMDSSECCVFHI